MVRFLHTSDWQMGMKAAHAGEKAREIRAKRFEAVERVLQVAEQQNVDLILIAGDTFEDDKVDETVVKRTVDLLNNMTMSIYILPGNHDPLRPGSVWERASWKRAKPHIKLCRKAEEMEVAAGVALYPCPLTQKISNIDPSTWIPTRSGGDERIRIGLAHGALALPHIQAAFPIAPDRAARCGLDYLALGDWHSFFVHEDNRTVYPGTIETTSYDDRDPGHVVVVQIDSLGAIPKLEKCTTGMLTWSQHDVTVRSEADIESLDQQIRKMGPLKKLVLRVKAVVQSGGETGIMHQLDTLERELKEAVFHLDWEVYADIAGLSPELIPDGTIRSIDEDLAAILDSRIPEGPGREFSSLDSEVVRAARLMLHRLAGGVQV